MNKESIPEVPPILAKIRPLWIAAKDRQKELHGLESFMNQYTAKAQELKKKYPDAQRRRAYHALIGSTIPDDAPDTIEEDFPGEDSVVGFLESLAR